MICFGYYIHDSNVISTKVKLFGVNLFINEDMKDLINIVEKAVLETMEM
jgi:hypothetical protein